MSVVLFPFMVDFIDEDGTIISVVVVVVVVVVSFVVVVVIELRREVEGYSSIMSFNQPTPAPL